MFDQILNKFNKVLQTLTTHFSQSVHLIVVILHKHQYLTAFFQSNNQIGFEFRALWTCVIFYYNTKKFSLVTFSQFNHWLSSKFTKTKIYPTLSIQWSNFKSDSGTRRMCVIVSNYHETSNIDQFWQSFENFDYSFLTIQPYDCCHTSRTPISHHILPIQRLDFGFGV